MQFPQEHVMKIVISAFRILFFVAIVGLMTETAFSQKLLKKVDPIPQDQKDFVTKMQVAMFNLKSAEFINNPVAKEEARTKATGELRTVKKSLAETIGREGITDWVAFCELQSSNLRIKLQILAQTPAANNSKGQPRPLSEEFEFDISLNNKSENEKIDPLLLESIKRFGLKQYVKFSLSKTEVKTDRNRGIPNPYHYIVTPSALKEITPLK